MKQETIERDDLSYKPCRYGASRTLFRGPRQRLDQPYLAFIGGTETYGKFIEQPFPSLVQEVVQQPCVNFGCINGGIDVVVNDATVMEICEAAELTVVQITGANHLSNRFYSVHPRRNDRFLCASSVLQAIYHDVDFSEFSFTRHMLGALHATSLERFDIVVAELRQAWLARMRDMLRKVGPNSILMWFSDEELNNTHWSEHIGQLQADPLFITADMIDELRPLVRDVVLVTPSRAALGQGTQGMVFPTSQSAAASEMLGMTCHEEASVALVPAIQTFLQSDKKRPA